MYVGLNAFRLFMRWGICSLLVLMFAATLMAQPPTVIKFDELPLQPVNGLTFKGVTFFFNVGGVPSTDASFHGSGPGPGSTLFVQDPSLEGNSSGTLWILFDSPTGTPYLVFGLARDTLAPLLPGALVDLFDRNFSFISRKALNTYPYILFSENLFNSPPTTTPPIRLVRIVFPHANLGPRFALDNLTFTVASAPSSTTSISWKEAMVRSSLAAGAEPALGTPPLPADLVHQLQNAKLSDQQKPGPWTNPESRNY